MACEHVPLPGGGFAIVCGTHASRGQRAKDRCACGNRASLLCDWKVPSRKSGTCDAPICASCTTSPAPDKDLCRKHAGAYEQWKHQRDAAREAGC